MQMEASKMSIMIKLFLLVYLLALTLITILTVIWTLTAIFTPEWGIKKASVIMVTNIGVRHGFD